MKKTNKKGFTIVELVIVIAVIAILAAVLIPTFSGIVKAAKLSADKQTVRQLNVALATGDADTYNEMADLLEEQGFNAKYAEVAAPVSLGHKYFWSVEHNTIVLVHNNTVVFPEDNKFESFDATNESKWLQINAGNYIITSTATTAAAAKEDIQSAIAGGNSITLSTPVVFDTPVALVAEDVSVKVDLAGSTLKTTDRGDGQMAYGFNVYGELELSNAIIEARGVEVRDGGVMVLGNDVKVTANGTTGGAAIYVYKGGKAIINGGEYSNSVANSTAEAGATAVISYGDITINGGKFTTTAGVYAVAIYGGTAKISNAVITSARGGIIVAGAATASITDCTVTSNWTSSAHAVYIFDGATVTISGGTFSVPAESSSCFALLVGDDANVSITNAPTYNGPTKGIN